MPPTNFQQDHPFYAVFDHGILVELTSSSKAAVDKFLGIDHPEGTSADGMYKIHSLGELEALFKKIKTVE